MFLGVDGGGTKTAYAPIDAKRLPLLLGMWGRASSHLSEGFARATELLIGGIAATLEKASSAPSKVTFRIRPVCPLMAKTARQPQRWTQCRPLCSR